MNTQCSSLNRRGFISGIIPGCALTCLAFRFAAAAGYGSCIEAECSQAAGGEQQEVHKFDQPRLPARTHRQLEALKIARFMEFAEFLSDKMSREQVIELLKEFQSQRQVPQARNAVEGLGSNDFA
ncbi:hypothetical protein ACFL6R_05200, partial [Gemmatimonadota bacterium]